jgi:hypothetical protein
MTRLPDTDRARTLLGKRGAFEGVARWPRMASGMGTDEVRSTTTNQPRHTPQRVVEKVRRSITNSETPHSDAPTHPQHHDTSPNPIDDHQTLDNPGRHKEAGLTSNGA